MGRIAVSNRRKMDHVRLALSDPEADRAKGYFDCIRLSHRALPELDLEEIDTSVELLGRRLSFPLIIGAMTGGSSRRLRQINENLARAAQQCGVGLAVGSQRVMFTEEEALASFRLRELAPDALLLANLGAVQLNLGFGVPECRRAVEVLSADGLCLHLNPLQEAVQPEGECRFAGLVERIGQVAAELSVPLIIKEVGCGLDVRDVELLADHGVRYFDVAGSGGTSWSRIEHQRQPRLGGHDVGLIFQDWGIPTPLALMRLRHLRSRVVLIASGGIRTGVDMVKAMVLGATACAVALPFLKAACSSVDAVVNLIEALRREFRLAQFLLAIRRAADLIGNDALILENPWGEGI